MNDQQIREITEAAFRSRFGEIEVLSINIRRGFDHDDEPMVDINIIYDGKVEQLGGEGLLDVDMEISDKVWIYAEDSPGWPHVHFISKSDIGRQDPATVFFGPAPYQQQQFR